VFTLLVVASPWPPPLCCRAVGIHVSVVAPASLPAGVGGTAGFYHVRAMTCP